MSEKKDNPLSKGVKETGKTVDDTVDTVGKTASNVFTETGKTAGSATRAATDVGTGAVKGVREVGEDAGDLVRDGAMGTLDAADDVGSKAGRMGKKAVTNTAALPHDIIKSAKTGEPEK